jgi:hypothetical protein
MRSPAIPWRFRISTPDGALGGAYGLVGVGRPRDLIEWVPLRYADAMEMMAGNYVVPRPAGGRRLGRGSALTM